MKNLGKKRNFVRMTVDAYNCSCSCTCSCGCNCACPCNCASNPYAGYAMNSAWSANMGNGNYIITLNGNATTNHNNASNAFNNVPMAPRC
jgi:putative bacteriocin precursor